MRICEPRARRSTVRRAFISAFEGAISLPDSVVNSSLINPDLERKPCPYRRTVIAAIAKLNRGFVAIARSVDRRRRK